MKATRGVIADRIELAILDRFPDALLGVAARELDEHLTGPTLFRIPGRQGAPLFVSVLLHGNEDTGWQAVQHVLAHYRDRTPPRPLILFVGNIAAARAGVRTLASQRDYNRTWPGTLDESAFSCVGNRLSNSSPMRRRSISCNAFATKRTVS